MTRWMETCKCGKLTLSTIKLNGQVVCLSCLENLAPALQTIASQPKTTKDEAVA
jgi:hypothetical protein